MEFVEQWSTGRPDNFRFSPHQSLDSALASFPYFLAEPRAIPSTQILQIIEPLQPYEIKEEKGN